jgi:hypothetical protein
VTRGETYHLFTALRHTGATYPITAASANPHKTIHPLAAILMNNVVNETGKGIV